MSRRIQAHVNIGNINYNIGRIGAGDKEEAGRRDSKRNRRRDRDY